MQALILFLAAIFAICDANHDHCVNSTLAGQIVAQSTQQFANKFLQTVANGNPGNLICSALSAQIALAMAAYGARGSTAAQMRSVLQIPSNDEVGERGYEAIIRSLNNVSSVELHIADKIYTTSDYGFKVNQAYQKLLTERFLSASQSLDFTNNATGAANVINAWCAQQTNNRITNIVTAAILPPSTRLLLVNAVYFKGNWDQQFDENLTQDRPFYVNGKTPQNVPTMSIQHKFSTLDLDDVDASLIVLPYKGKEIVMYVILPNERDGLQTVIDNLDKVRLNETSTLAVVQTVQLYLPKFEIESTLQLVPTLTEMGMGNMFQNSANFSGISTVPLKITDVIQKAFIQVNEEGSEAAAVTIIGVGATAVISPPLIRLFTVDHPFMYVIYDVTLKIGLFSGFVYSPSYS